jgi:hypothetical protein
MCEATAGQSARRRIDLADAGSVGGMCGSRFDSGRMDRATASRVGPPPPCYGDSLSASGNVTVTWLDGR